MLTLQFVVIYCAKNKEKVTMKVPKQKPVNVRGLYYSFSERVFVFTPIQTIVWYKQENTIVTYVTNKQTQVTRNNRCFVHEK